MSNCDKPRLATDPEGRLSLAVGALNAVRGLCMEASHGPGFRGLSHVESDDFASLLGLVIDEMNAALGQGAAR